ncbi:glycine-rich RNA-binding protein 1-like [Macadamia integrifolia]|uniref:glycine-rich RNA-binding protein 1-like n=1 Tax=Macadamia integrifolia TaxID=60698 RepID=UPI001C4E5D80|nr:glycine-rich RNA-binding protein 1-like [Macadamia integrifolia]
MDLVMDYIHPKSCYPNPIIEENPEKITEIKQTKMRQCERKWNLPELISAAETQKPCTQTVRAKEPNKSFIAESERLKDLFVTFRDEQAMRDAIEGMNGQSLDGRNIILNKAHNRGSSGGGACHSGACGGYGGGGYSGGRRDGGGGRYSRGGGCGYSRGGGCGYCHCGDCGGYGDGGSRYSGGGSSDGNGRN